jgi:malonyl-CoA decarboxylase
MIFDALKSKAASLKSDSRVRKLVLACRKLLSEKGEASGASLAGETLALYAELDSDQRVRFFKILALEFSPDPGKVLASATAYAQNPSAKNLAALTRITEPPRQELLRRFNRAPGGTQAIVSMRERLLDALRKDAELSQVDADFRHLLSSWFNPGFLRLLRVDWYAPAALLEQLIKHEAVHEIRGWNDLHRRLEQDRRCFAFFHPVMPDEPLIFVEVALVRDQASEIGPLLDVDSATANPRDCSTAVFYSISNCQPGLRGVSLGNFLIKQVVDQLTQEFPRLKRFCTLSPVPGFRDWLKGKAARGFEPQYRIPSEVFAALAQVEAKLGDTLGVGVAEIRLQEKRISALRNELLCLVSAYLTGVGEPDGLSGDPVARFHLHNGAKLDRLNWGADASDKGLRQSLGLMVNYVYEPRRIEYNHEQFVRGVTVASKDVTGRLS